MSTTPWIEPHYRSGCWVKAYRRSDGAFVRGHHRRGGNVNGHYTNCGKGRADSRHIPDTPRRPRRRPRRRLPTVRVEPTTNMATVAMLLETNQIARVRRQSRNRNLPTTVRMRAVIYRDEDGAIHRVTGFPATFSNVDLPPLVESVTLEFEITLPDGRRRYRIDAPVFCNSDGSVSVAKGNQMDPKVVNSTLDRIMGKENEMKAAQRRNQVRQRLGTSDPERAVSQAMHDIMRLNPPPKLDLRRELTIPVSGANYAIIVRPLAV